MEKENGEMDDATSAPRRGAARVTLHQTPTGEAT